MTDLEWLESLDQDALLRYVDERLRGRPSRPPVGWSRDDLPEHFIEYAQRESQEGLFRERLRKAVGTLLTGWRPHSRSDPEYGARLIYLAGFLRVEGGPEALRRIADDPSTQQLVSDRGPLPRLALRNLAEYPIEEAGEPFWAERLTDTRFFDAAYVALSRLGPEKGLKYLPSYVNTAYDAGETKRFIQFRLMAFINNHLRLNPPQLAGLRPRLLLLPSGRREEIEALLEAAAPGLMDTPKPAGNTPQSDDFPVRPLAVAAEWSKGSRTGCFRGSHARAAA